jgi:hypothetical protein
MQGLFLFGVADGASKPNIHAAFETVQEQMPTNVPTKLGCWPVGKTVYL